MSSKKNNVKLSLIYIRYLLPVVLCALLVGAIFIPCLSYSTVEGTQKEISSAELMENSWDQVRAYLFLKADREVTQERFSWTVLILLPVLLLAFAIGVISAVITAIVAMMYINNPDFRKSNGRIWFITLIPNRIVLCILQALILPLLFYSRLIIVLYDKIMNVDVLLNVSFPEPWVWGLISMAIIITLSAVTCNFERELHIDTFKKIAPPIVHIADPEEDEEDDTEPTFKTESERIYYEQQMKARREQEELIRKLLNKNDKDGK